MITCDKCDSYQYYIQERSGKGEIICANKHHVGFVHFQTTSTSAPPPLPNSAINSFQWPFGKWKGVPVKDSDPDYILYMLGQMETMGGDLLHACIEALKLYNISIPTKLPAIRDYKKRVAAEAPTYRKTSDAPPPRSDMSDIPF